MSCDHLPNMRGSGLEMVTASGATFCELRHTNGGSTRLVNGANLESEFKPTVNERDWCVILCRLSIAMVYG